MEASTSFMLNQDPSEFTSYLNNVVEKLTESAHLPFDKLAALSEFERLRYPFHVLFPP
jgi:hypothetical protein